MSRDLVILLKKNYLAAIRDFADRKGIDPRTIPNNYRLDLGKKISGNVDKAWGDKCRTTY